MTEKFSSTCFAPVYENLFQVGCMGLLPVVLHYNYSAGVHTVPVMMWVLLWVDFKHEQPLFCIPTTGYEGYVVQGITAALWQKVWWTRGPTTEPLATGWSFNTACVPVSGEREKNNGESHFRALRVSQYWFNLSCNLFLLSDTAIRKKKHVRQQYG